MATKTIQVDEAVGAAIRDSKVPRSEIFITSKFWPHFGAPENVEKCVDKCLKNMGLDYFDLFLAHWPVTFKAGPNLANVIASEAATPEERGEAVGPDGKPVIDWEHSCESLAAAHGQRGSYKPTWRELQRLVGTGKIRAAGVSNFNIEELKEVMSVGGVPVSCNQLEGHPWLPNTPLIDFMKSKGILATMYSPFAPNYAPGPTLLKDPEVKRLAEKNDMGLGQLLLSWAVQRGTIPLGKSQTPGMKDLPLRLHRAVYAKRSPFLFAERIRSNLAVRKLSSEDFEALNAMDQGEEGRTVDLSTNWGLNKLF